VPFPIPLLLFTGITYGSPPFHSSKRSLIRLLFVPLTPFPPYPRICPNPLFSPQRSTAPFSACFRFFEADGTPVFFFFLQGPTPNLGNFSPELRTLLHQLLREPALGSFLPSSSKGQVFLRTRAFPTLRTGGFVRVFAVSSQGFSRLLGWVFALQADGSGSMPFPSSGEIFLEAPRARSCLRLPPCPVSVRLRGNPPLYPRPLRFFDSPFFLQTFNATPPI